MKYQGSIDYICVSCGEHITHFGGMCCYDCALKANTAKLCDWKRKAVEVLKDYEWRFIFNGDPMCCGTCNRGEEEGHAPGCKLAELLKGEA